MIKKFNIKSHSPEWYKFRTIGTDEHEGGTGASEIGILLGLSHYNPTLMQLYHYKVGTETPQIFDSERMFHGRNNEAYIGRLWQCWDGTTEGLIDNYNNYLNEVSKIKLEDHIVESYDDMEKLINENTNALKYIKRKANRVPEYLVNTDYPNLFCSLDFQAADSSISMTHTNNIIAGTSMPPFPIECKTIDKDAARALDYGFPDMYIAQLNSQMLITESNYGEIAILSGGNSFKVYGFERNDVICRAILDANKDFWENRILPARELLLKSKSDSKNKNKYLGMIQHLEPDVDSSPAYKIYLSDKHETKYEKKMGDKEIYDIILKRLQTNSNMKDIGDKKQYYDNIITNYFVKNKCDIVTFGEDGYVSYKTRKGGKNKGLSFRSFKARKNGK